MAQRAGWRFRLMTQMRSILGFFFEDKTPNALDLFFGNSLLHFIAMRNKNFEGVFQGEDIFIYLPQHI